MRRRAARGLQRIPTDTGFIFLVFLLSFFYFYLNWVLLVFVFTIYYVTRDYLKVYDAFVIMLMRGAKILQNSNNFFQEVFRFPFSLLVLACAAAGPLMHNPT